MRRGAFGAAVALSLVFGAGQALASPAPEPDPLKCKDLTCDTICKAIGAFSGQCTPGGGCACAI